MNKIKYFLTKNKGWIMVGIGATFIILDYVIPACAATVLGVYWTSKLDHE